MADFAVATDKSMSDFEQKNAPVTPPQDVGSDANTTLSKTLENPIPQTNGDSLAQPTYLGLHPALSNGASPEPAAASLTSDTSGKGNVSIEQPVESVAQGIQPIAPFVPEQRENPMETQDPDPTTTSTVPPAIDQPVSDVRDEPTDLPPVLDSGIAHADPAAAEEKTSLEPSQAANFATKEDAALRSVAADMDTSMSDAAAPLAAPAESEPAAAPSDEKSIEEAAAEPAVAETANVTQFTDATVPPPTITDAPSTAAPGTEDTEMAEAPAAPAANGVVRPREEDESEEPAAKRTKTEEEPALDSAMEFKKPELPALSTDDAMLADAPDTGATATPVEQSVDATPLSSDQKRFLIDLLRRAKKTKDASLFKDPVDYVALNLPTYPTIVTNPMDLGTVETKLKTDKYGSVDDMISDISLIVYNTTLFNGQTHTVTYAGVNTKSYLMKQIQTSLPRKGSAPPIKPKQEKVAAAPRPALPRRESRTVARSPTGNARSPGAETYALQPDGTPLIRRDSSAADGRPKREIHRPQPKDLPYQSARPKKKKHQTELKFCAYVMKELMKKEHQPYAYPFYDPVDPVALNIPSYHKVIKKPMDLGTVQSNLKNGLYSSGKEFKTDVELIFGNCYKFNPATDGVHQMGKQLEDVFKGLWEQKDDWIREHSTPETRSDEEDEDEEEDEEEEEADPGPAAIDASRLAAIQAQINALNAEMTNLVSTASAGNRKSPPAKQTKKGGKKGDAAASGKKTKRSSSAAAITAPAGKAAEKKKAAPKKIPKLSQEQKREVSEGIGLLDDAGMRKAVQIIRNGVPSLQNVNDDELELDIDEIPEAVVYDLYKFVRSLRPKATVAGVVDDGEYAQEPDDEEFVPPSRARGATAGGAGPGRKKNKPMTATAQEAKIQELQSKLHAFKSQGDEVGAMVDAAQAQTGSATPDDDEDEDDDADGSSSEEE